ncbi:MAG: hypothetical protein GEU83_10125 [Pseudonocardiaceae bacterium]|nr:hypothetical protein [Pseudonocardiaceae bacterium]
MDSDAGREPDGVRLGEADNGTGGFGASIRPGVPVPATVLVVDMGDGALLLQGWRDGPAAYVSAADGVQLRTALAAAFGDGQP